MAYILTSRMLLNCGSGICRMRPLWTMRSIRELRELRVMQPGVVQIQVDCRRWGSSGASDSSCSQQIELRPGETHDDKNARLGRPLSPHLSIYSPQYTSILSILHRITGTVGSAYLVALSMFAVLLPYDFCQVADYIDCLGPPAALVYLSRFAIAFPYIYHTCNGCRHLMWDTGTCLELNRVLQTGIAMAAVATISTLLVVFVL